MSRGQRHIPDFAPSGFFVLRTPLLALAEFTDWSDSREPHGRLRELVGRPEVRDALFVASPDLDDAIAAWLADATTAPPDTLVRTLVRYLARMCARTTPFGLFAGCTLGAIGDATHLELASPAEQRPHSRMDMDYLSGLVEQLRSDPEIRSQLIYRPNETLYRAPGAGLRYVRRRISDGTRTLHLVALRVDEPLTATLERAAHGATITSLAHALASAAIDERDATVYVNALIDKQVLLPDLELTVTGTEPAATLSGRLRGIDGTREIVAGLDHALAELAAIDSASHGTRAGRCRELGQRLAELPARVELRRLFQVDTVKPARRAELGPDVVRELQRGTALLARLSPAQEPAELRSFRERLIERYETAEVPLLEALDEETGVGLTEPVSAPAGALRDIPREASDAQLEWTPSDVVRLELIDRARRAGRRDVELTDDELQRLAGHGPSHPLPSAVAVTAVLAAESPEALAAGEFELAVTGASGPSGARAFARFCQAEPRLHAAIAGHLRDEEALHPDAVLAEIVHLPDRQLHVGNLLTRPVLRRHEIAFLAGGGAPQDDQIPLSDLLVSVDREQIVLRSRRLGRRILPRLTNSHNFYDHGLGVYRFLALLQMPWTSRWSWGPLVDAPFCPRVSHGRLILSRATWTLRAGELTELPRIRPELGLPRLVQLTDGDRELLIDLDNDLSVQAFTNAVRGRSTATLVELWPDPSRLVVDSPDGRLMHELIVPMVRGADFDSPSVSTPASRGDHGRVRRRFPPGSAWTYAKLYCGRATADSVLRDLIAPLTQRLIGDGAADRWHFLRFADPDVHLRVRFHGESRILIPELLAAVSSDERIWRVQLDTYVRECERYGGPEAIEWAEQAFHADSDAVLAVLQAVDTGDRGREERRLLALAGIDSLLDDFGLSDQQAATLLAGMSDRRKAEFQLGAAGRRAVADRFRGERSRLEQVTNRRSDAADPLAPGHEILARRSARLRPVVIALKALEANGRLVISTETLLESIVHLHVNRLLRFPSRADELFLLDAAQRLRRAKLGREAQRTRSP